MPRKVSDFFTDDLIHKTAQEFAVSYNNHALGIDRNEHKVVKVHTPGEGYKQIELGRSLGGITFGSESRKLDERIAEIVAGLPKEDERFADLDKLVDIVSRVTETPDSARLEAEKKLYGLVMTLNREGRIHGGFGITPYRNAEIERLEKRIDLLTKRLDGYIEIGKKALR